MPSRLSDYRSRQKSCVACAEGKRRCNRQTPQCSRCLGRGVECVYINGRFAPKSKTPTSGLADVRPVYPESQHDLDGFLSSLSSGSDSWLENSSFALEGYSSPSLLTSPSLFPAIFFPDKVTPDKWAINQCLRIIKSFPRMFAKSRETPFIHSRLYDINLPSAIQDAFMVSTAYSCKTPQTEDMTLRVLESKTASLIEQGNQMTSPREFLASVQALMLFHILQLFDGDIRQRSIAEHNVDTLRAWTMQLQLQAQDMTQSASWEDWIFAESARRTVIFSILIDSLYMSLKFGYCTHAKTLSMLPVTSGSKLWKHTSAAWVAECDQATDIVLYGDFSMAWENGRVVGELDDFQKLLLIPCVGERYKDVLELEASP